MPAIGVIAVVVHALGVPRKYQVSAGAAPQLATAVAVTAWVAASNCDALAGVVGDRVVLRGVALGPVAVVIDLEARAGHAAELLAGLVPRGAAGDRRQRRGGPGVGRPAEVPGLREGGLLGGVIDGPGEIVGAAGRDQERRSSPDQVRDCMQ